MPHDLQRQLDTAGTLDVTGWKLRQDVPLFLDRSNQSVRGGEWDTRSSGTAFVQGFRRGLISDAHYASDGFHFKGDCFLMSRGTDWDLGPRNGGWPTVRTFTLKWTGQLPAAGVDWRQSPIAGMNADSHGYSLRPAPWVAYWRGGLKVSFTTTDGAIRTFQIPAATNAQQVLLVFTVDFTTGVATALVNGVSVTVDVSQAGSGWNPNLGLQANTLWPFGVGRIPPCGAANGYIFAEGAYPDWKLKQLEVWTNGALLNRIDSWSRPATYGDGPGIPAGPSLPLLSCWPGARWLYVCRQDQDTPSSAINNNRIEGATVFAPDTTNPLIQLGETQGGRGVELVRLNLSNGRRGIQGFGFNSLYPLSITDVRAGFAQDCAVWLFRACGVKIQNLDASYAGRCYVETLSCVGSITGESMQAVPGPPAQLAPYIQHGGNMTYVGQRANYEYSPLPEAFLKLYPAMYGGDKFPTCARVVDCGQGGGLICKVGERHPKYPADVPTSIVIDQADPTDRQYAIDPAAGDVTVNVVAVAVA